MPEIATEQFEGEQFDYDVDDPLWTGLYRPVYRATVERHASTHNTGGRDPITISAGGELLSGLAPSRVWVETDATIDNGAWDIIATGEAFVFRALNDARAVATAFITIERTGTVIDSISVPNLTVKPVSGNASLEIRGDAAGGDAAFLDFGVNGGDSDYDLRMIRGTGANGSASINNRGTGNLTFQTNLTDALVLASGGAATLSGPLNMSNQIISNIGAAGTDFGSDGSLTLAAALTLTYGQIVFPATQNASAGANTLDDYEEGTWTPTGNNVTLSNNSTARYEKIGRLVRIACDVSWPSTADGNTARIQSLPFTVGGNDSALAIGYNTNANSLTAAGITNQTYITIFGLSAANIVNSQVSTDRLIVGGTYSV